jgi:DHA1 family inner membrane transport protein
MFGGLTIANVLGAPFGTFIGEHWGWRASFWVVTVLAVLSLAMIVVIVPRQTKPHYAGLGREFAAFTNPHLWWALTVTGLSQAGLFAAYSYFSPIFTDISGFPAGAVPLLQALFGAGCFAGTFVGGRFTDRYPKKTLCFGLVGLVLTMALFALLAPYKIGVVIALAAFGIAAFSINPALQSQVITEADEAPTLATTTNTSAFNVGNTIGPWLGGVTIDAGLGFASAVWVGVILTAIALVVAVLTARDKRPSVLRLDPSNKKGA